MPLINVKNITVTYGKHKVIDNLSFSLEEGDFLCIVGPNGSGKSTLLKAILGEAKIHSGNIILDAISSAIYHSITTSQKISPQPSTK